MIWFTVLGVLMVFAGFLFRNHNDRLRAERRTNPESERIVDSGSVDQARKKVDQLIAAGDLIQQSVEASPLVSELAPTTKDFFLIYGSLRTKRGGFLVSASELRPSDYVSGYLSIGHSEDWDIVQLPGGDEVLLAEGSEADASEIEVRFSSVYHLAIDEAATSESR